jgi:hypothetical protein
MDLIKKLSPFSGDIKYWRTVAFILFVLAVATNFYGVSTRAHSNKIAIEKSTEAVQKSCILLNNKILEATQKAADPKGPTAVLVQAIARRMTERELQELARARKHNPTGDLTPIDCQKIASHPEDIRAVNPPKP